MDVTRETLHCVVCGYDWWKRLGEPDPKRCARKTCRSLRWKGTTATPADSTEPKVDRAGEPASVEEAVENRRYVPLEEVS